MKIRKELHPIQIGEKHFELPDAPFTLRKEERYILCKSLKDTKMPDRYESNISNCVDMSTYRLNGMKSHDLHVMMQNLLPMALCGLLDKPVRHAIIWLCKLYNDLCQRELDKQKIARIESNIPEIMCAL